MTDVETGEYTRCVTFTSTENHNRIATKGQIKIQLLTLPRILVTGVVRKLKARLLRPSSRPLAECQQFPRLPRRSQESRVDMQKCVLRLGLLWPTNRFNKQIGHLLNTPSRAMTSCFRADADRNQVDARGLLPNHIHYTCLLNRKYITLLKSNLQVSMKGKNDALRV